MNVVTRTLLRSTGIRTLVRTSHHALVAAPCGRVTYFSTGPAPHAPLSDLVEALKHSKDLSSIHASCSALAAEVKKHDLDSPPRPSPDATDQLLSILHLLAVSGRAEDIHRIDQILRDFYPVLGLKPTRTLYTSLVRRLAEQGHLQQVQNLLLKMPLLPGPSKPDLYQMHLVLNASSETSTFQFLRDFVADMRRMNQRPSIQTFAILFNARWKIASRDDEVPSVDELASLVREYVRQGLPFDPLIAEVLYVGYSRIGKVDQAKEILNIYELATNTLQEGNEEATEETTSNSDPAIFLLRHAKTYADIKQVSERLGIRCMVAHYSIVLNNSIKAGNLKEALHIYEQSKVAGIVPDAPLISPLLRALARESSEESIDKAIAIYRDLANAVPTSTPVPTMKSLNDHSPGPDAAIYGGLFRMLLSSPNTAKYIPILYSLLDEMEARGLPMDTNSVATTKIILEMRQTRTFADALDTYLEHRRQLNEHGYAAVLQEYCRISFSGNLEVPLITDYFSFINDMRQQKLQITPTVYTIILNHLGITATRLRQVNGAEQGSYQRLIDTTRRVHDFLTLDASISPDAILWNQLMNTYQRLGCLGDAYRVWEMMYLTGRYDQISVNIMLDACSYAGQMYLANSIRSKLAKVGFALDTRNWNTWVECLCRNGEFDDATNVVCFEMEKHGVDPNLETFRILLKFSKRLPPERLEDILRRLQKSLPHLWSRLQEYMRNI
ncbi:hypothetical protein M413DRAFT_439422, partial [Hebeloma cylindrosporum]